MRPVTVFVVARPGLLAVRYASGPMGNRVRLPPPPTTPLHEVRTVELAVDEIDAGGDGARLRDGFEPLAGTGRRDREMTP